MKVFSSLIIFVFSILLQGCITATTVSTATIGKVMTDPRTIGTQIDDNILEFRINKALSKDKQIREKSRIEAIVFQRKVLLIGQVLDTSLIFRARQIITDINGTTKIFNEIRQCQPINLKTISSDTWITTKIRFQFLRNKRIKSSNIKVKTENSEVFLLGLITKQDGKIAADIASRVRGVKHITSIFTYIT